ncbi:MAG: hypothetical protein OEW16_05475 [Gammaproteobacteria bacterium]|nr:hypothetical protein [Gammaproteobacteria bacterium]
MRHSILLFAALLTAAALAIEPPKSQAPPPAAPAAEENPATPRLPAAERPDIADADKEAAAKAQAEADAEEDEVLPPLPDDMTPAGPPPARFNPTEKVRADFPVSFPIDI